MPVVASEIRFFGSSTGNNLGGAIDESSEIVDAAIHNLFSAVVSLDAENGQVYYSCIYVKNTNATLPLTNSEFYIHLQTANSDSTIGVASGNSGINGIEVAIVNDTTAPVGPVFSDAANIGFGANLGEIPAGGTKAVWVRRTISSNANAISGDMAVLAVTGDTA